MAQVAFSMESPGGNVGLDAQDVIAPDRVGVAEETGRPWVNVYELEG